MWPDVRIWIVVPSPLDPPKKPVTLLRWSQAGGWRKMAWRQRQNQPPGRCTSDPRGRGAGVTITYFRNARKSSTCFYHFGRLPPCQGAGPRETGQRSRRRFVAKGRLSRLPLLVEVVATANICLREQRAVANIWGSKGSAAELTADVWMSANGLDEESVSVETGPADCSHGRKSGSSRLALPSWNTPGGTSCPYS
jgi:hypothetical protein